MGKSQLRAQAIPLDFAAGLFIFVLLLVYFIIQWDLFAGRFADRAQKGDLDVGAIAAAEMLVHTGGYPENWTSAPNQAKSIGLAGRPNVLDWEKVSAFAALPYANAREALGTDHDFLVVIETPEGARFATIGQQNNSTRAAEVARIAIVNNTMVHVKVRFYD